MALKNRGAVPYRQLMPGDAEPLLPHSEEEARWTN